MRMSLRASVVYKQEKHSRLIGGHSAEEPGILQGAWDSVGVLQMIPNLVSQAPTLRLNAVHLRPTFIREKPGRILPITP